MTTDRPQRGVSSLPRLMQFPPMRNALGSGGLLAVGLAIEFLTDVQFWVPLLFFIPAIILGASHWGLEALEALQEFRINIDVLMGVATAGSAALGLWEEAAFLAFLYGTAEALEEYAYERTTGAINALLDLTPVTAHLLTGDVESLIPANNLKIGDRFIVRPGESIPTDGEVVSGVTSVDESSVTGESVPIDKSPGSTVLAGTINSTGSVVATSTKDFQNNTISRIVELVKLAQEQKSNVQRRIDRFGNWYSPTILGAALLLWLVPSLFGGDIRLWSERAITLAVAGAPCALVMSTPVAVAAAIGKAGKRGVLIKGGIFLERLSTINALAFDKTGTLTLGKPSVTEVVPLNGFDTNDVITAAIAVERLSEHPLAQAIVQFGKERGLDAPGLTEFRAVPGFGATGLVSGSAVWVGNRHLMMDNRIDIGPAATALDRSEKRGETAVLVASDKSVMGTIALSDPIRTEAKTALEDIRLLGIQKLTIISGDNQASVERVAKKIGIQDMYANSTPEGKLETLRHLQSDGYRVAMIGDGINDAPALAAADVGIAMGVAGTDAAIEAADVALMGDDLRALAFAIDTSHVVARISRQNLVLSSLLLVALLPLAAVGAIGIAVAVLVHEVSELLAVGNGLRVWKK